MKFLMAFVTLLARLLGSLMLIQNASAQTTTTPPPSTSSSLWGTLAPCPTGTDDYGGCFIYGPTPNIWGWAPVFTDEDEMSSVTTVMAYTVVTVYNTVANTSRITTVYNDLPENFTMPNVNSDGTRIETINFTRFDTVYTTVVTYPTPFFDWPDYYGVGGEHITTQYTGNSSSAQCILGDPVTGGFYDAPDIPPTPIFLTDNPQPTDESFYRANWDYNLTEDPYGHNFVWLPDGASGHFPYEFYLREFIPNEYEHPFNFCDIFGVGPHLGRFGGSTAWFIGTANSTSFEGDDETPETTSSEGTASPTTVPRPTTTSTSTEDDGETTTATQGPVVPTATSTEGPRPTVTVQGEGSSTSQTQSPDVPQSTPSSFATGSDPGSGPEPDPSTGVSILVTTVASTAYDGAVVTLTVPGTSVPLTTVVSTAADGALVTLTVPATSIPLTTFISTAEDGALVTLTVPLMPASLTTLVSTADDGALVTLVVPMPPGTRTSVSLTTIVSTADDGAIVTLVVPVPPTGEGAGSEATGGPEPLPSTPVAGGRSVTEQRRLGLLLGVSLGFLYVVWYM